MVKQEVRRGSIPQKGLPSVWRFRPNITSSAVKYTLVLLTPLTTGSWLTFSHRRFDIRGDALAWFVSYFDDRTQVVTVGRDTSLASSLSTGVPQGSVLGPRSYVIYAEDAQEIFEFQRVMTCITRCITCSPMTCRGIRDLSLAMR